MQGHNALCVTANPAYHGDARGCETEISQLKLFENLPRNRPIDVLVLLIVGSVI
jgi:hypothetical protein